MKLRVLLTAFTLVAVGGCSFTEKFEAYCRDSGKCECTNGECCVLPTFTCDPSTITCCSGSVCSGGRCVAGTGAGTDGGGGGEPRPHFLTVIDAGQWPGSGINLDGGALGAMRYCADGGQHPTWIRASGTTTHEPDCCAPNFASGICSGTIANCTLPGFRSSPGRECCFCDENCAEDEPTMLCPSDKVTAVDIEVVPVPISSLEPEFYCADGGLKVLGGCCSPDTNMTSCSFGTVSCSLEHGGSPCCFTAWAGSPSGDGGVVLSSDCRVNGNGDCNPLTRACGINTGGRCVDITR